MVDPGSTSAVTEIGDNGVTSLAMASR
jgi:hypothetical protein